MIMLSGENKEAYPRGCFNCTELVLKLNCAIVYFFLVLFFKNFKLDNLFFLAHLSAVCRVMYRVFLALLSAKLEISLYKWTLNTLVTLLKLPLMNEVLHQLVPLDGTTCTSENSSEVPLNGARICKRSRGSGGQWRHSRGRRVRSPWD